MSVLSGLTTRQTRRGAIGAGGERVSGYFVTLHGVKEAIDRIHALGYTIRKTHARNAVSAAGGVFRRAAEAAAPVESGTLKRNIRVRVGIKGSTGEWFAAIGARRKVKDRKAGKVSAVKQAVRYGIDGRAKRVSEKRAATLVAKGVNIAYRSPSRYIHLAEQGARRRFISPASKKVLAGADGTIYGQRVISSARGHKFLSQASKANARAASEAAIRQLEKAIKNQLRRAS